MLVYAVNVCIMGILLIKKEGQKMYYYYNEDHYIIKSKKPVSKKTQKLLRWVNIPKNKFFGIVTKRDKS